MESLEYLPLNRKINEFSELVINLFDHCNLKCNFCFQDHNNQEGITEAEILSKVPYISSFINSKNLKYFKLHLMGGEIFQDWLIEQEYLDIYKKFISSIQNNIIDKSKYLVINPVTNLVFDKTNEVLKFLQENDIKISISYDPRGRFNNKNFEIFKRNIEIFKNLIDMVSLTMTNQNIEAIINGDPFFDYLYSLFPCYFDPFLFYENSDLQHSLIPRDSQVLRFYKVLIDKYPQCLTILPFTDPQTNAKISCTRGNNLSMRYDNFVPKGCSGEIFLKDSNEAKPVIVQKFIKKYDCYTCEYYSHCPFTCFIKDKITPDKFIDLPDCIFKLTFDYARNKN